MYSITMDEKQIAENIEEGLGEIEEQVSKLTHSRQGEREGRIRKTMADADDATKAVDEEAKGALDQIEHASNGPIPGQR
jgi:uncharacterized protein YjbJ (UPF0337 family)